MKKRIIIIVCILLIIVGLIIGFILLKNNNNKNETNTPPAVGKINEGYIGWKKYSIEYDDNNNGIADIGDEISIVIHSDDDDYYYSYDEHFVVISNDGIKINAFAKDYLLVGEDETECSTGVQNMRINNNICKCDVQFINSKRHGYEGSLIENYINDYVRYLNSHIDGLNATGRLIYKEEIEKLINNGEPLTEENIKYKSEIKGYSWLYDNPYWTGSFTSSKQEVWAVDYNGNFCIKPIDNFYKIRPVIIIDV